MISKSTHCPNRQFNKLNRLLSNKILHNHSRKNCWIKSPHSDLTLITSNSRALLVSRIHTFCSSCTSSAIGAASAYCSVCGKRHSLLCRSPILLHTVHFLQSIGYGPSELQLHFRPKNHVFIDNRVNSLHCLEESIICSLRCDLELRRIHFSVFRPIAFGLRHSSPFSICGRIG